MNPFPPRHLRFACLLAAATPILSPPSAHAHGDVHERIEALSQQIAAQPGDSELYVERAGLYRLHGDLDHALADLEVVATLDPDLPQLDRMRGTLLHDTGLPHTALVSLNRFLQHHPDDVEARLTRARIYASLGHGNAAAADYHRAISKLDHPTPESFIEQADALLAMESPDLDRALQGLDEGIRRLGPIPTLQSRAIDLELARSNPEGALTRLQSLIDRSPTDSRLLLRKGDILAQTGEANAALAVYQEALHRVRQLPQSRRTTPDAKALAESIQQRIQARSVQLPEAPP